MTTYETEEQQIQAIKDWWKKNGSKVTTGLLVVMAIAAGSLYWTKHQQQMLESAAAEYAQMRDELSQGTYTSVDTRGKYIQENFPDSPYAMEAGFLLARSAVLQEKLPDTETALRWVMEHSKLPEFQVIARIRLARILVEEGRPEQGLGLLSGATSEPMNVSITVTRGDVLSSMGRSGEALEAYESALAQFPETLDKSTLLMKIDNLKGMTES